MSDYVIPRPEPKEIDEKAAMDLRILSSNAGCQWWDRDADGDHG